MQLYAVELTTYSRKWLTHTVYETKGASLYIGWLRFIELGLGVGLAKVPSLYDVTCYTSSQVCFYNRESATMFDVLLLGIHDTIWYATYIIVTGFILLRPPRWFNGEPRT